MMKQYKRHLIQAIAAFLQNANVSGFWKGTIYQGAGKQICVPGLNCYSCPGALGSCPIGSLQAVNGGSGRSISYYVTGMILLFGVLFGRLICGFLCPFGLLQDLLHKIPFFKRFSAGRRRKNTYIGKADRILRWGKYAMLAAVLILPVVLVDPFGIGAPYFCKYVCPVGTLEGGIPLMLANESLRQAAGFLFSWKMGILLVILILAIVIYRPFCKYLCPLGAAYGILNTCSVCRMKVEKEKCTECGACSRVCKMGVDVTKNINSAECIRCGLCVEHCPEGAIQYSYEKPKRRLEKF